MAPRAPPVLRVDGKVIALDGGPLDGLDIEDTVLPALAPHARGSLTLAHGLGFWRWWWVGA